MISKRAKNAGLKELEIFDKFEVDMTLPKHLVVKKSSGISVGGASWADEDGETEEDGRFSLTMGVPVSGSWNGGDEKLTLRQNLVKWLSKEKKEIPLTKEITILEFFTSMSKSFKELTPIADIAEHYEKALIQAKTMGQVALLEKLKDLSQVVRGEAQLIAANLKQYVTEKQVIEFYEKVGEDKALKLTWIKNFGRIIPEEVYAVKKDVDDRKIFDNYVILHYDPKNTGDKMTKKEIEDKKDPILFGLIKNSRKLYYVADWKDDYCQLTLEEMFTTLGEKVLSINNKNVKTFINNVKA